MKERPTVAEFRSRLSECARYYGGAIPREAALVWDGYFAGLLEWGLIGPAEHAELIDILPKLPDSPVLGVFLGWGEDPMRHDRNRSGINRSGKEGEDEAA